MRYTEAYAIAYISETLHLTYDQIFSAIRYYYLERTFSEVTDLFHKHIKVYETAKQSFIDYLNSNPINKHFTLRKLQDELDLSWSGLKKIITQIQQEDHVGLRIEKSGNIWIIWKDRNRII